MPDEQAAEPIEKKTAEEKSVDAVPDVTESVTATGTRFKPVHKILTEVLEEAPPLTEDGEIVLRKRIRYPLFIDLALGLGLLVAVAGFTIGLFKMYVTHSAQQHMADNNYEAAINVLKKNPLPPFFSVDGNDPQELLDQALYADAMKRMTEEQDVDGALRELEQIRPGSQYFDNAQQIIAEKFLPSSTMLTGGVKEEAQK